MTIEYFMVPDLIEKAEKELTWWRIERESYNLVRFIGYTDMQGEGENFRIIEEGEDLVDCLFSALQVLEQHFGPKCSGCGCTEHDACAGGCSWAEQDLCSSCVGLRYR